MAIYRHRGVEPRIDPTVFVAPGARIIGDVTVGPRASIWFNAVLRGDYAPITVGARTNIQDLCMIHTDTGFPCTIGEGCVIGHQAIVHGCTIGNDCLVGMGAIILNGAKIGDGSVVAAGALVPEGKEFPPRSLLMGVPARLVRTLTEEEVERLIRAGCRSYEERAQVYKAELAGE
ncbi:MAG: gamma carbonic anhydrase family protein [Firmicutes bacterium]|nr:gamma carbonic anhydrase family protein [Bacillota bacterium]